jgi:ATP-dependent helicase HrpA
VTRRPDEGIARHLHAYFHSHAPLPPSLLKSFPFRLEFPPELPISSRAEEITAAIQQHQVIVLAGETGSGKSTQIPKMCLAAGQGGRGRIACTQPRRVAALSLSRRVAEELNVEWGREVGCKVRFHDQTTSATVIKFVTDGMLLAEMQGDPMLREYDTIILDEAHERSLNIDFLLGHLRTLRFRRPELKVLITSATIDTAAFSQAFDAAPIVVVEGRTFPVEVVYAPLDELGRDYSEDDENEDKTDAAAVASARAEALHYVDGAVEAVERILQSGDPGDILVFFPSERDIREARDLIEGRRLGAAGGEIVPLFGRLSNAEQQRVFAPTQRRKIVLATNIAETSLTIPGIRFVIDTGLARLSRYSPQARTRRLPIEEVAQSSADQRKGRAGRVADGVCIRLYSEKNYLERPRFTQPEIQRANLADVILRMKAFGLGDIERFPFINLPAAKAIRSGYALLEELGALAPGGRREPAEGRGDEPTPIGAARPVPAQGSVGPSPAGALELTPVGRELARLPVDPTVGRMILQARKEKALREVVVIAAGLSIQDPRERPLDRQQQADAAHRRFAHRDSDFLTLLNIWDAYHAEFETMSQAKLRRFCREHFLSYTRMREWRDIHAQLLEVLEERDDFRMTSVFDARVAGAAVGGERRPSRPDGRSRDEAGRRDELSRRKAAPTGGESRREAGRAGGASRQEAGPADPLAFGTPAYRAIHRSVLAGLLGNIARLDEETGAYKATHDRKVALFPGSVLFRREERKKKGAGETAPPRSQTGAAAGLPRWIMASEIVETTRLYARTCARLDPPWALELGGHIVRVAHSEPFWNEAAGRVMVKQRTRLYGLEIDSRSVGFGRIDPVQATELFIREGLVADTLAFPLDFLAHNRAVREKVEDLLTRARDSGYLNLDEAAYRFYAERLMPPRTAAAGAEPGVSSVAELVALVRERRAQEPRFLFMEAEDLRDPDTIAYDPGAFPEAMPLDNRVLPLNYAYKPGQADDGVTVEVSIREAETLTPAALDWAVPGHLEPKVEHYLRALPKELRRGFVPLAETARRLAADLARRRGGDRGASGAGSVPVAGSAAPVATLPEALAAVIAEHFRIAVDPAVWHDKPPPDHLRVRVRVVDASGREMCASRDLDEIRSALLAQSRDASLSVAQEDPAAWRLARARWETPEYTTWAFDELPERVLVTEQGGVPVYAFPGLGTGTGGVSRRLFKTPEEARVSTQRAIAALLERQLGSDLGWTQRDLKAVRQLGVLAAGLLPMEELEAQAFESIRRWATDSGRVVRRDAPGSAAGGPGASEFTAAVERARADLRGLVPRFVDLLREILTARSSLLVHPDPPPGLQRDVERLVPPDFLRTTPFGQLAQFPRYLKAMALRAGRWRKNPAKDAERAARLAPYVAAADAAAASARSEAAETFRWLVEEFRVSLFVQELGTAEPVSAVKLDRALAALRGGPASPEPPAGAPKPIVATPVTEKKPAPIKSLGALDKLFGR